MKVEKKNLVQSNHNNNFMNVKYTVNELSV